LIQLLSSIGREKIDLLLVPFNRAIEEMQIAGLMSCLEAMKQDGHIGFIGLHAQGPAMAVQGFWQFNDAFEFVMMPRNPLVEEDYQSLASMARERRAGIVTENPFAWRAGIPCFADQESKAFIAERLLQNYVAENNVLMTVRTAGEVKHAVSLLKEPNQNDFDEGQLASLATHVQSNEWLTNMLSHPSPRLRAAAKRIK